MHLNRKYLARSGAGHGFVGARHMHSRHRAMTPRAGHAKEYPARSYWRNVLSTQPMCFDTRMKIIIVPPSSAPSTRSITGVEL
jgi:hypothetical protein